MKPMNERKLTPNTNGPCVAKIPIRLLEVAQQPACGDPRMPARVLAGDQERQLERVGEPEPRELLGVASAPIRFPRSSARRKIV
jgi:hypothetical protein